MLFSFEAFDRDFFKISQGYNLTPPVVRLVARTVYGACFDLLHENGSTLYY
jgi:hypothetical protein